MSHTRQEQMEAFGRFLDILDELRVKCPWDRKQTNVRHASENTKKVTRTKSVCLIHRKHLKSNKIHILILLLTRTIHFLFIKSPLKMHLNLLVKKCLTGLLVSPSPWLPSRKRSGKYEPTLH